MPAPQHSWYSIRNQADERHAEILVYSEIGQSMWGDSVDAKTFVRDLQALEVDTITLRLNSPGGDVFDGVAIYNALRDHDAKVTVKVDGLAASIASVIMLAGDDIVMGGGSMVMIHEPWGFSMGNSSEMRAYADLLDKIRGTIVDVYTDRTSMSAAELAETLSAGDTWMSADEAVANGFAHRVEGSEADSVKAMARLDERAVVRNVRREALPERVAAALRGPTDTPAPTAVEPEAVDPALSSQAVTVPSDMDSDAHTLRVRELLTAR